MRSNMKIQRLTIALCLIVSVSAKAGTNLNILNQAGTEKNVNASSLRTITFTGANLNLNYQDGNTEAVAMTTIRKIYFSAIPVALRPIQQATMALYPNPTAESLNLKNLPEGTSTISIWHISGRKVLSTTISSESTSIDVSGLATGLYLVKIQNQTLRFSKK
jgi:hypothetical protein